MNNNDKSYSIQSIGLVRRESDGINLEIKESYVPALKELEQFSHVQVLWWMNALDDEKSRSQLQVDPPYGENPPKTGVFATRSPLRPNPIGLTIVKIENIDHKKGIIKIQNIDAFDKTPIIDLKAYFPICDRVKNASIPSWIKGWPEWVPEEGLGLRPDEVEG